VRGNRIFYECIMIKPLEKFICLFVAVMVVGGCAGYHPMPLTQEAVAERITPPELESIRVQAESIKHPILMPIPFDYRNGLSPDEAAILAVIANPMLRAVRDKKEIAAAQILQAGILPNPELSYNLEVPSDGNTAGKVNGFGLGLGWDITSLISRAVRVNEAKMRRASIELDIAWQEWQVAQAAKSDVYQLASLGGQVALAEEIKQRLTENLVLVRKAVANGSRTAKDLSAVRTATREANAELIDLKKQAEQQRLQLKYLLGMPPTSVVRLQDGIELPSHFEAPAGRNLLKGLDQRRLDMVALRRGYDGQEAAVRAAILEQFPKINIGPTIGRGTENVNTAGFALSIALTIFNRNQGRISFERATRQRLFDEYISRVFEAQFNIQMIRSRICFLNQQIAVAQAAEPELQKLVKNYRVALNEGRTDTLTYYAAWNDLASNRKKVIVLKGRLAKAVVALELAAGMYEIPQPNETSTTEPAERKEVLP